MLASRATPPLLLAALALVLATPVPRQREPEPQRVEIELAALAGDVIAPQPFRDAQDWPHGMVIRPPATPDRIALAVPADGLWSALFAPLADALLGPSATLL